MNDSPKTWKEWQKKYQNVIKHSPFEWDFVKEVCRHVPNLRPSQVIPQHLFIGSDGYECHMDFAVIVDNVKIAIELEGFDKTNSGHGQTKEQHHRFMLRQQALTKGGWTSYPITNAQFKRDPMYYANEIRLMILAGSNPRSESVTTTPKTPKTPPRRPPKKTPNPSPEIRRMILEGSNPHSESVATTPNPLPVNNQNKQQLLIGSAIVLGLLAVIALLLTNPPGGEIPVVEYPNCAALKKVYSGGIAESNAAKDAKDYSNPTVNKSVYDANKRLDGNTDGVMCDS